jgi:hypothetical protein
MVHVPIEEPTARRRQARRGLAAAVKQQYVSCNWNSRNGRRCTRGRSSESRRFIKPGKGELYSIREADRDRYPRRCVHPLDDAWATERRRATTPRFAKPTNRHPCTSRVREPNAVVPPPDVPALPQRSVKPRFHPRRRHRRLSWRSRDTNVSSIVFSVASTERPC